MGESVEREGLLELLKAQAENAVLKIQIRVFQFADSDAVVNQLKAEVRRLQAQIAELEKSKKDEMADVA